MTRPARVVYNYLKISDKEEFINVFFEFIEIGGFLGIAQKRERERGRQEELAFILSTSNCENMKT
jgi:hypothetical protein